MPVVFIRELVWEWRLLKGLIEQMHGSIEVTSQVGVGSVFVITIPFEIAREQKKDKEIAEKYDIRGLHLLAAEDNELNAEIIEMLLTDDGAKVTVAKNGRQAVEHFENNPPGTFDAILMDVMMPVMDGIAATKPYVLWTGRMQKQFRFLP